MKLSVLIPGILVPLLAVAGVLTGVLPRAEAAVTDDPAIEDPTGEVPDPGDKGETPDDPSIEPTPTPIPIDPTDPDFTIDTEPSPIVAPGYLTARENGIALIQTSRSDSLTHHGWVDVTLDLVLTSFVDDPEYTPSVSLNEEQTKACFATSLERADCMSVQWGSHEQFVAQLQPIGPANPQWAPGKAQVWALTFEVPANALNASIVFGSHRVPLALGGQIEADTSGHVTAESLRPTPAPSAPAGTEGYYIAEQHGIAVTEVKRVPHDTQPSWVRVVVDLDVMRFDAEQTLDPAIETDTSVEAACFVASETRDCVNIRWGYDDVYDAILTSGYDNAVRYWPRAKAWPHQISFVVPSNVYEATLMFGDNAVHIDLLGEEGPSPEWNYQDHYAALTGLTLHDSGGHSVDLVSIEHDLVTSNVVLHFEAANRSENRDFYPRIVFDGSRVSSGGQVFDGLAIPKDGWTPATITVQGGPLAPGEFEEIAMVLPRIGGNGFTPVPFSADPPAAMLVRLAADNNISGAPVGDSVMRFAPYYVSFRKQPGDADATYFYPDLAVTAIAQSNTPATAGDPLTLTFTVANVGPRNALATSLDFMVDGALVRNIPVPAIPAHGETSVQAVWTATLEPAEITAVLDPADLIEEAVAANNMATYTYVGGELPDLVVSQVRLLAPSGDLGVRYEITVLNQGLGRARPFQVLATIQGGSTFFMTYGALAAGESAVREFGWTSAMGSNPVALFVDGPQSLAESDETNNHSSTVLPNLRFTNATQIITGELGEVYVDMVLTNAGDTTAPIATIRMLLDGEVVMGIADFGPLAPGETVSLRSPALPSEGRSTFTAEIDSDNAMPESDETDNVLSFDYTTGPLPELSVSDLRLTPATFVKDDDLTLYITIFNTGTVDADRSTVEVWDMDADVLLGTLEAPHIKAGDGWLGIFEWNVGETLGDILILIDPDEMVDEEDEENNTAVLERSP